LGEFRARRPKRILGKRLRRFAGAEGGSGPSQFVLNPFQDWLHTISDHVSGVLIAVRA